MDYINGLSGNTGASWGAAKKSIDDFTAAILNPGDVIKIAKSPDATSMGQNFTWTSLAKSITATNAVTLDLDMCESGWIAGTGVTLTYDTGVYKEGVASLKMVTGAGVTSPQKLAYKTLSSVGVSSLDCSGYQQLSFWFNNAATLAASALEIRLCSDALGVSTVNTFPLLSAALTTSHWLPVVIDGGINLGSEIQSIAIYNTVSYASKTNYFDDFIVCKASSSPDSLNLTSLIAKDLSVSRPTSGYYSTSASNDSTVGTIGWTNINNILISGISTASALVPMTSGITYYAKANDFDFTFDPYANILIQGITVEISKSAEADGVIRDYAVKIVKPAIHLPMVVLLIYGVKHGRFQH
jgi:hypothetical protein